MSREKRGYVPLLMYDEALVPPEGAAVYAQLLGLSLSYTKDPAGHIFHQKALMQLGLIEVDQGTDDVDNDNIGEGNLGSETTKRHGSGVDFSTMNGEDKEPNDGTGWRPGKNRKKKNVKKKDGVDLYALLGLQHERWMASEAAIKAAYRRAALEHHPDKQRSMHGDDTKAIEESEDRFKAIQKAYETLSDPAKRREFDSLDAFDDSLPGEADACTPQKFYEAFGSAFKRYSKWSVKRPVPELGADEADMKQVEAFYEFWFAFKSWREFPHPDEEDIEMAESREERRWIERYNAKLREKPKKEEVRRIRNFVDLAYKMDPRIIRKKEALRAEKERIKAAKEADRLQKEHEKKLREEEEEKKKQEQAMALAEQKKQRQSERKALQKERSRLRKICGLKNSSNDISELSDISVKEDDVEKLCADLDLLTLRSLCESLAQNGIGPDQKYAMINEKISFVSKQRDEEAQKKLEAAKVAEQKANEANKLERAERIEKLKDWTEDEIRILRKGLDKFPPGTSRRWEAVQNYVRTRTIEEVLDMVKYGLKSGKFTAPPESGPQIAKKRMNNLEIKSDATSRIESFTDVDVNLRGKAAVVLGGSSATNSASVSSTNGGTETQTPKQDDGIWSQSEEIALVKALKDVPKTDEERWKKVAAAIGSKTEIECMKKFKEMKASYKAKKQSS